MLAPSRIVAFLEQHAGESLAEPYRADRAVLFESRLFRYSDAPEFAAAVKING